jgi:hypothetical protein
VDGEDCSTLKIYRKNRQTTSPDLSRERDVTSLVEAVLMVSRVQPGRLPVVSPPEVVADASPPAVVGAGVQKSKASPTALFIFLAMIVPFIILCNFPDHRYLKCSFNLYVFSWFKIDFNLETGFSNRTLDEYEYA